MAKQRHKVKRKRSPFGLLTPEQLLVHREPEFLRVAGQPRPKTAGAHRRHNRHLERRALTLRAARQLVGAPEPATPGG